MIQKKSGQIEPFSVQGDETDDIFTEQDEKVYQKSIQELRNGEAISLDQAKQELPAAY
jgi:predicted phosphohydrolase